MKVLVIIPARGGSKGIPRKNVRRLCGRPLIAWSIQAALGAKSVSDVLVSTDDPEIAEVARHYGAEVIARPAEISGDTASSEVALVHGLEMLRKEGRFPELLVFLQCTSPLTTSGDIDAAVKLLCDEKADSVLTATDFHYFLWKSDAAGGAVGINHDKKFRPRRQDREPEFQENGAIYVMRAEGFLKANHRFFGKTVVCKMPREHCWEIDDPVDFEIAEMLLRKRLQTSKIDLLPSQIEAVVFDFDGVITDNKVIVGQDRTESVVCDRSDGMGIAMLKAAGMRQLVLSTEANPVVTARCAKLDVECLQGLPDKAASLKDWALTQHVNLRNVVYVGNDINDAECMELVGCPVAVADAYPEAKRYATVILDHAGGNGAVRELAKLILNAELFSRDKNASNIL